MPMRLIQTRHTTVKDVDHRRHDRVEDRRQRPGLLDILAVLEASEIAPHTFCPPGFISRDVGDVVPVASLRDDGNHRIVHGATAEGGRPWIPDHLPPVPLNAFQLLFFLSVSALMPFTKLLS